MALAALILAGDAEATPISLMAPGGLGAVELSDFERAQIVAAGFEAKAGRSALLLDESGARARALFCFDEGEPFSFARFASALPPGDYALASPLPAPLAQTAAFAWAAGQYVFARYKASDTKPRRLALPPGVDGARLTAALEALELTRDLINAPPNAMGPAELEQAARALAGRHEAALTVIDDEATLAQEFPLILAVGDGSPRRPRLIDLTWGDANCPKVTLVGKGVCFDTGGLDLKPSSNMLLMKKDMGGAATVLGLAHMIMAAKLPVRLRVLIPAVENSVSGASFRPSDIFRSRKGLSVEIGNTDAEGRLVLADALALADEEAPDLIIDMATLTGAARVALGPDLPPFFTDDEALAAELQSLSLATADPLWRLPLWPGYRSGLDSKVADLNNAAPGLPGFAGAITAALFLARFVDKAKAWVHLDIYGWTPADKPGRPVGGEMQAARALFTLIASRYRHAP